MPEIAIEVKIAPNCRWLVLQCSLWTFDTHWISDHDIKCFVRIKSCSVVQRNLMPSTFRIGTRSGEGKCPCCYFHCVCNRRSPGTDLCFYGSLQQFPCGKPGLDVRNIESIGAGVIFCTDCEWYAA